MSFEFKTTRVFSTILKMYLEGQYLIICQGGTRSSKTYSIIQLLVLIGLYSPNKLLISIVSESLPHLRRGAFRTFKEVMGPMWDDSKMNASLFIYQLTPLVQIEFFSADQSSKLRGAGRDILFLNECNNISHESFKELSVRTAMTTFVDFNPTAPFWIDQYKNDKNFFISTYLDAREYLPAKVVKDIESRRNDKNWWRVFGLGLVGSLECLVFPDFVIIDAWPESNDKALFGLDFGYSDPCTCVRTMIKDKTLFLDEMFYKTGLTNQQIAKTLDQVGVRKNSDLIYADSAEPKSIEEIKSLGYFIKPCLKGPDSVLAGIKKLKEYDIKVTRRSTNGIYELRQFQWVESGEDANGNKLYSEKTVGIDHFIDASRYAIFTSQHKKGIDYANFNKWN